MTRPATNEDIGYVIFAIMFVLWFVVFLGLTILTVVLSIEEKIKKIKEGTDR